MSSLQAIRVLVVNCPELAIEESGLHPKLIVHRAADGRSMAQQCKQFDYRMILLQLPLPDLSPKDCAYYIRQQPDTKCKESSVVVIASAKDQALIHEGMKAGLNDYMVSPVSRERLEAAFARFGDYAQRREVKLMLKARVDLPGMEKPFFGQAINLSRRGLLLLADRELLIGAPVELQFSIPGDPRPVKVAGMIVREAGERRNVKGKVYGVHFTHVEVADRLRIADFARK